MLKSNMLSRVSTLALLSVLLGAPITPTWAMEREDSNLEEEKGNNKGTPKSTPATLDASQNQVIPNATQSVAILSKDILFEIFGYLSPKDLSRIAPASKQWNAVSSDDRL